MDGPEVRRTDLHVPTATIIKLLIVAALIWCGLRILPELALFVVAVILAIAIEPAVDWLDRRHLSRGISVVIIALLILAAAALVAIFVVPPFIDQVRGFIQRLPQFEQRIQHGISPKDTFLRDWVDNLFNLFSGAGSSARLDSVMRAGQATLTGVFTTGVVLIVMLYLVLDGKRLYAWLLAYVPPAHREKVAETVPEVTGVIRAYVRGQALTSLVFSAFAVIFLTVLRVPAAVPLALFAGLCDVIPMIGILIAIAPAVLLAFATSLWAAAGVVIGYLVYHQFENYVIAPRVYGARLRLSTLTVLLALIFGGSLFGLLGAVLTLPLVAAYPTIERIWLRNYLGPHVIDEHDALESAVNGRDQNKVETVLGAEKRLEEAPGHVLGRKSNP
jgi:predicted PurR-regulated permease PerM